MPFYKLLQKADGF
jgi:hypothetical protein